MSEAKKHWERITFSDSGECIPLKIVSDALVSTSKLADGKLLPAILVDCSSRSDVKDLIKAHRYITPGDVNTQWGKWHQSDKTFILILSFKKPSKCKVVLEFDILKQGGLVDQIMRKEAFILQCAIQEERFMTTMDREKIIIEIPSKSTWSLWNEELFNALYNDAKSEGMSKKQAKEFAGGVIQEWRKFGDIRKKL
ncbi:hypothetical protein ACFLY3_01450 [Chloroflexota bacterium]